MDHQDLTLDPENWDEFRADAHRILDSLIDHLSTLESQPVWQPMPFEVQDRLAVSPPPLEPTPLAQVHKAFVTDVLPYTSGNRHGRAWGWVRGNGTPVAMVADLLASGINAHVGGGNSAPVLVEEQVLDWIRQLMGLPGSASGLLTSGASMANLLALSVAFHSRCGQQLEVHGWIGSARPIVYCSRETHFWVHKAVRLLGLGSASLHEISVDETYRMDLEALRKAIAEDRRAGKLPLAVIANAGTVNTGSFDDLLALRSVCDQEDLWLHVDAAYGAWLRLAPSHAHLVAGLEKADSLALDLHKWMWLPFETGCLLIRNRSLHEEAFRRTADYLTPDRQGPLSGDTFFSHRGYEGSRGFKALRIWMSFKTHGVQKLSLLIEQNLDQARYLSQLIEDSPDFELLAPTLANIVCFRWNPAPQAGDRALSPGELDEMQRGIMLRVAEQGRYLLSGTTLRNGSAPAFALRVAVTNHRTTRVDLEALLPHIRDVAHGLERGAPQKIG
jgi:aromatic-L-amino-acid/L-tryptophan decarboxylase